MAGLDAMQSHSLCRTHYQAVLGGEKCHRARGNLYRSYPFCEVLVSLASSQVRRRGGESAWYTLFAHALNRHGILWRLCSYMYVRYWGCQPCWVDVLVGVLFECVLYPFGSWVPRDKAQEKTGCLQWVCLPKNFMQLGNNFGKPTTTLPTRYVSDSTQLGWARSSIQLDYSVLRTNTELIFDGLCYLREPLIIILVYAPNSATWPLL